MTANIQDDDQASKDLRAIRGGVDRTLSAVERLGRTFGIWILAGGVFYLGAQVAEVARAVWSVETSPGLIQAVDGVSRAVKEKEVAAPVSPARDYLGRDPLAAAIAAQTDAIREEARRDRIQRSGEAAFGR